MDDVPFHSEEVTHDWSNHEDENGEETWLEFEEGTETYVDGFKEVEDGIQEEVEHQT